MGTHRCDKRCRWWQQLQDPDLSGPCGTNSSLVLLPSPAALPWASQPMARCFRASCSPHPRTALRTDGTPASPAPAPKCLRADQREAPGCVSQLRAVSNCRTINDFQLDCISHGWCCLERWLQGAAALLKAVSASCLWAISSGSSCAKLGFWVLLCGLRFLGRAGHVLEKPS